MTKITSKYRGVSYNNTCVKNLKKKWSGRLKNRSAKRFETEIEAAKFVDLEHIKLGLGAPNGFYKKLKRC